MKNTTRFLFILMTSILFSCSNSDKVSDAYGNFEAIEVTVSSEAQGKMQMLNLEEGMVIDVKPEHNLKA